MQIQVPVQRSAKEVHLGQTNVHNSQQPDQRYRRSNQQRQRRQSMNSSQRAQISMRRRANYQTRLNSVNIVQNQTEVNQEEIGPTSAGKYDFYFFFSNNYIFVNPCIV